MPSPTDIPSSRAGSGTRPSAPGAAGLDLVVLDCPHPAELARFYAGVLGWVVETEDDDSWAEARPSPGATGIGFQSAPGYRAPTWPDETVPQQSHLDVSVDDLEAAEANALRLGARKTGQPSPETPAGRRDSFRVYFDPVGHPFCLVRRRRSGADDQALTIS
ncbi:VOC family protein [Leifsonia sp. NPDC058248]|uniref:VOC family protein n=1 Tax=Leifsonia sp. NPDC058248 TaxID=3346402 RepID=UPI0036DBE9A4